MRNNSSTNNSHYLTLVP